MADGADVNEVRLVGRVTAVGEPTTLPSGDVVHGLRVTVRRTGRGSGPGGRGRLVDAVDVSCWTAATRRTAARLALEDRVEVTGSLRRRFFRAGGAASSRYEVEARTLRRSRPDDGTG